MGFTVYACGLSDSLEATTWRLDYRIITNWRRFGVLGFQVLGFGVLGFWGLGFGVYGLGMRVLGSGFWGFGRAF